MLLAARISNMKTWTPTIKGSSCVNTLDVFFFFFYRLWMSLDAVWRMKAQSAPADGGVGHKFTQTCPQWNSTDCVGTRCIFQYSCLCWSQVFSGSRVANWLLNNKLLCVNQPITNKCQLVLSCTLVVLLFSVTLQFWNCLNAAIESFVL